MGVSIAARTSKVRAVGVFIALFAAGAACTTASAESYVPDPTWNNGQMYVDNFASSGFDYRRGQKVAEGDNGDVITAGVVPGIGAAAGHTKLGLVRYNHAGVRQTWSNAGANGSNSNQYVITPCNSDAWCGDVKDVKGIYRFGSRIYVLADTEGFNLRPIGNPPVPQRFAVSAVEILVFGLDGSFHGTTTVDSEAYANDGSRSVYGGGIAVFDNLSFPPVTTLVYAGTGITEVYRPRYARFNVESSGALTALTAAMEPAFGGLCAPGDYCQFTGIATGGRIGTANPPRIYISGLRWHPGPGAGQIGWAAGWDLFVASVNSSGTARTNFATNGLYTTEGIGSQSAGQKIAVRSSFGVNGNDEIFVVGDVELACRNGIALIKLNQDGTPANTFGNNGKVMYGGSDQTNLAMCNLGWLNRSIRSDFPTDIVYANDALGVAGLNIYGPGVVCVSGQPCPEDNVDGEVAVIDANTGAINSWRGYAYSDTVGGPRTRHSGFFGISTTGDGTFSVAGDVRYLQSAPADRAGKQVFATLRVAPLSDVIFKYGFELNP
ncbi:MAG: hypothetical protein ABIR62_11610 [Dokdonella sp.]|uniref:hypothetical protein n=1 Tax=Dokdonella sp. TaxID=2291710 RepID=UPI003264E50A